MLAGPILLASPDMLKAEHNHPPHTHAGTDHGHAHAPATFGLAFAVGIGLNTAFVIVEVIYGYLSNSMALVADAGHNLSDVLGLIVAWIAIVLAKRPPSPRYTYGLRGSSILAALFNAVFLLVAVGAIGWEAILRLFNPAPVASGTVLVVATIGIVINGFTAWLFASGGKNDINIRGAYLHMAADAAVSVGVVAAALAIMATGWLWIDPVISLIIGAVIVAGTWGLLKDSIAMSLNAVPRWVDSEAVRDFLASQPGVTTLHDLHIWPMSTTELALTCHLVIPEGPPGDDYLVVVTRSLREKFSIEHATIQIEADAARCLLAPDHVV